MRFGIGRATEFGKGGRAWVGLALLFLLPACSSVPNAINPSSWYRGVAGIFGDDKESRDGIDKPYPNLGSVPGKPDVEPEAQRREILKGLVADRDNARYTNQQLHPLTEIAPPPPAATVPAAGANAAGTSAADVPLTLGSAPLPANERGVAASNTNPSVAPGYYATEPPPAAPSQPTGATTAAVPADPPPPALPAPSPAQ